MQNMALFPAGQERYSGDKLIQSMCNMVVGLNDGHVLLMEGQRIFTIISTTDWR
jgi:hypothetical protein